MKGVEFVLNLTNRQKKRYKIRKKVFGTQSRPRLSVFKSAKNVYAQIIDDSKGITLVSASSKEKNFGLSGGNKEAAKKVGLLIGKRAVEKGIKCVVFDRSGYVYHGRVANVAQGARESKLEF